MRPTFLVIGGQRCATTWLHEVLRHHPEIYLPDDKEPEFLNRKILGEWSLRDYGRLFEPARPLGLPHRGELSVNYSVLSRPVVQRIARLLPGLRLVFTLRHPVDRAWSQAKLVFGLLRHKRFDTIPLAQFLRFFEARRCTFRNDYARTLDVWSGAFGPGALHVDLYDRLVADPRGYLADLLRHLGADASWQPDPDRLYDRRVHASQPLDIPPLARWYLSRLWLEPTQRLNDRLGGRLSHWVEDLREHAQLATPTRRLYRLLNRHVLTLPERLAYAGYYARRQHQLARTYDQLLSDLPGAYRALDNLPDEADEPLPPSRPSLQPLLDDIDEPATRN